MTVKTLAAHLNGLDRTHGLVLAVTGAGISLASGIPTFRGTDKDAVWKRDIIEMATFHYFSQNPAGSWRWYLERFATLEGARPNDGHRALVDLERWCDAQGHPFLLVTQNIDDLHRQAGSKKLIEVHGSAAQVRCSRDGCELGAPRGTIPRDQLDLTRFRAAPSAAHVPRCPLCSAPLRPHVLWFDEYYASHESYHFDRVTEAAEAAAVVLFVGTSFAVGVTDLVLSSARRRKCPVYSVDPAGSAIPAVLDICEPAESALVALAKLLNVGSPPASR